VRPEIVAVVEGRHGDPFAILGPHDGVVRAFIPGADAVEVTDRAGDVLGALERVHPAGFFEGKCDPQGPYRLRVQSHAR
jgi:1,4-alpha-glucan branching enzyme